MVAYKASKAAIISINRNLGTAYANKGIRVNAVVPGVIGTEMWAFSIARRPMLGYGRELSPRRASPRSRWAEPADRMKLPTSLRS